MRVEASGRMQRITGTLSTSSLMSRPVCGGRQMFGRTGNEGNKGGVSEGVASDFSPS